MDNSTTPHERNNGTQPKNSTKGHQNVRANVAVPFDLHDEALSLALHHEMARTTILALDRNIFPDRARRELFGAAQGVGSLLTSFLIHDVQRELENQVGFENGDDEQQSLETALQLLQTQFAHPHKEDQPASRAEAVARELKKRAQSEPEKRQNDFADLCASEIPPATIVTTKGDKEELAYDPAILVGLLYPKWKTVALDTETAHARRICELLGDDLFYCSKLGFLLWNNRHWETDDRHATGAATWVSALSQRVRIESAALYALAGTLAKSGRTDDARAVGKAALSHLKHAKNTEARRFISESLKLAAGAEEIKIAVEAFDQKPWRLGFQNGVWDKGEWREHRRDDFALSLCSLDVDFDFDQSEWLQVLERITGADADFARTLQEMVGYILSGASHLRLIPWLYGPKGTGKSTLAELIQTVLGKMAQTIDPKKLQDDAARERLGADLWNRRLAVCAEAGGQKLEAELLKTLSGGDTISVRFLYQEAFDATPRHVLMMVSNDAPRLDAYDDALKDRVVALPFVHPLGDGAPIQFTGHTRIESARQDPQSALVRGFIVWALEGLKAVYHSQTVFRAECLTEATATFWADTDPLTSFWTTVGENQLYAGIPKAELRRRYENWCACEGAKPLAARNWTRACVSFGLRDGSNSQGARTWRK
jgi:P4 family phage/plasmid primase-like protien